MHRENVQTEKMLLPKNKPKTCTTVMRRDCSADRKSAQREKQPLPKNKPKTRAEEICLEIDQVLFVLFPSIIVCKNIA